MTLRRCLRDALIAAVAFVGLQAFQGFLLKDALRQQDHLLALRLEASVAGVLTNAHKAKDDIAIYHILNALSQSRGVVQARLVDAEGERTVPRQPGVYLYALKDGEQKWSSLVLSLSDRCSCKLIRRQWLEGTLAMSLVWTMLFLYLQFLEKQAAQASAKRVELTSLLEAEKRKLCNVQEREQMALLQISAGLQKALGLLSVPVLVLDSQQRLSAVSPPALSVLGIDAARAVIGKSWHEISLLASCGKELEKSLVYPGQSVPCSSPSGDFRLLFETDADGLVGTWVTLSRAIHVVE